jgi:UDP-GlcNAc:undecaprenyl-phosphate/decaprenyl-phosphate GlcNAc-1-phosphate transferase
MRTDVIATAVAFSIALVAVPAVLSVSRRYSLYDADGPLKIHTRRTSRLGGIAIAAGLFAAVLLTGVATSPRLILAFIVFLLVWGTGLMDDLRGLNPIVRLAVQLGAGLLLFYVGWSVPLFGVPVLDALATCIFVAGFINAFNLLDGADGVAGGVALVVALGYALLPGGQISLAGHALAWALAGSCLAFLCFNFPPARIFMGDSGSTLLGLAIAFLGLDFFAENPASSSRLGVPILFAALPLVDLALAIVRRLRSRAPLFEGDRQHLYDLLLQHGWPARRVALTCCLCSVVFVVLGRIGSQQPALVFSLIVAAGLIPVTLIAVRLGSLRVGNDRAPTAV